MGYPKASGASLKAVRALVRKSVRTEKGLCIVEGNKLIFDAIGAGWIIDRILVTDHGIRNANVEQLLRKARERAVAIEKCSEKDMDRVTATEQAQGVLAVVRQRVLRREDVDLKAARVIVALDALQDPGNVGTCIRSADWFGVAMVLLGAGCASIFNAKTIRASAGSVFRLPCVEERDLARALADLRDLGFEIVGADALASLSYKELADAHRVVLVLGSEAAGLSENIRKNVTRFVGIPRTGGGESLNVSVAGSIILASLTDRKEV